MITYLTFLWLIFYNLLFSHFSYLLLSTDHRLRMTIINSFRVELFLSLIVRWKMPFRFFHLQVFHWRVCYQSLRIIYQLDFAPSQIQDTSDHFPHFLNSASPSRYPRQSFVAGLIELLPWCSILSLINSCYSSIIL